MSFAPRPTLVPIAAAPVAPRRTINPLIPICCLALILFLIAATIVLSLIPVYLDRRDVGEPNALSAQFTLFLVLRNGFLPIGPLSAENCLLIQNELRRRALSSSTVRPSVPTVISCTVVGNSTFAGRRKKRQNGGEGNQINLLVILSPGNCRNNRCILARARFFINFLIGLGDFILTLFLPNGSSFDFVVFFAGSSSISLVPTPGGAGSTNTTTNLLDVNLYTLTNNNLLQVINAQNPGTVLQNITITGVIAGDLITNIDFRPATGELYGTSNSRLYAINVNTGAARVIGSTLAPINGNITSMEFDPVLDTLRVITDGGDNLQVDPENAQILTRNTTATNGGLTSVAFSNNLAGATTTTLFLINAASDVLIRQNPPGDVALIQVGSGLGVNITEGIGFDIGPTGVALAAALVGDTVILYLVDVTAGTFSQVLGALSQPIVSIAIPTALVAYAIETDNNNLLIANALTTNLNLAFVSKSITGLQANESILGIDLRPLNGQLYGIGSTSRLYTIDLGTAVATALGSGPFSPLLDGTAFGVDFNPTVDRLRVVSNLGQNLRLNPDTGAVVGVDTPLNPDSPNVTAIAYTNNVADATTTVLFDIDSVTNRLSIQVSPNNGTLVDVGPLGIDVDDNNGFDVGAKSGIALALVTVNGVNGVYQISLTNGTATLIPGTVAPPMARGFTLGFNI